MGSTDRGTVLFCTASGLCHRIGVVLLHFRYQLGFIPSKIDGKRHELKVELTRELSQGNHWSRRAKNTKVLS